MRRVAAILNRHAGGVSAAHIARVRAALGAEHVWATGSLAEARAAMAAIVAAGHDVVCTGGGDGTFVQAIADLVALDARPILFGLRLGTGNAIADVCGAGPATAAGLTADLARAAGDEPPGVLRLLDVGGRLAHSAGAGLDAEFNLDLDRVAKAGRRRALLRPLLTGGLGVVATAVVRTLPRVARGHTTQVRVVAIGPAHRVDGRGRTTALLPDGAVLHDGPTLIVSCGSVETYGRGVIFFPFTARDDDRFQLRLAHAGAAAALRDLVHVVRGAHHRLAHVDDFLVRAVSIEVGARCPAHVGGEVFWPDRPFTVALSPVRMPILRARC